MPPDKPAFFDLELRPNRSLSAGQARLVLLGVGLLLGLMGFRLLWMGAWPVIPFLMVDAALLAWALRASRRAGDAREHLRLDGSGLELVRVAAHGAIRRERLDPHCARVELERLERDRNRLWLADRGRRVAVGAFLSPAERVEIADRLDAGLRRFRSGKRQ